METKRKIKYAFVFSALALPIFLVVFFVFTRNGEAEVVSKGDVVINELMWAGSSLSIADEFIELKNVSDNDINIEGWILSRVLDGKEVEMLVLPKGSKILAKKYFLISNYAQTYVKSIINIKPEVVDTAVSLSNDELQIKLYKGDMIIVDNLIDTAGNGKAPLSGENSDIKKSMERNLLSGDGQQKENWHVCASSENLKSEFVNFATPGAENSKPEEKISEPPKVYSDKIQITELFPNPFKSQYEEYVELYNSTSQDVDLFGWTLHDASKSGKYTFPVGFLIKAKKYLAVFKKDFKFALNNSGDESVTLFNSNGKEVSKVSYDGSKQNLSYAFDNSLWRWSKFLTPGNENIFNNEPYGKLKNDKNVYVKVYANFSISTGDKDGDNVKVVWNFGDGHKSYLTKTRHKYEKVGKYSASVKLSDGSEDVLKEFVVEVKKFPHPKVSIIAVNANPKGKDSEFETLTIKNDSKKKINFEGWSIATGTKKLANHPIREKIIIKKGKTKEITRQFSSFSLNNKKAKIELRYPDGKVASKLKYDHGKVAIAEDEIYEKAKGGWVWKKVTSNQGTKDNSQESMNSEQEATGNNQNAIDNEQNSTDNNQQSLSSGRETTDNNQNAIDNEQNSTDNNQQSLSSEQETTDNNQNAIDNEQNSTDNNQQSLSSEQELIVDSSQKFKRENKILNSEDDLVKIELLKNQPAVLGAETVREVDGQYFFTSQVEQKHYLVVFLENFLVNVNAGMNQVLNYF